MISSTQVDGWTLSLKHILALASLVCFAGILFGSYAWGICPTVHASSSVQIQAPMSERVQQRPACARACPRTVHHPWLFLVILVLPIAFLGHAHGTPMADAAISSSRPDSGGASKSVQVNLSPPLPHRLAPHHPGRHLGGCEPQVDLAGYNCDEYALITGVPCHSLEQQHQGLDCSGCACPDSPVPQRATSYHRDRRLVDCARVCTPPSDGGTYNCDEIASAGHSCAYIALNHPDFGADCDCSGCVCPLDTPSQPPPPWHHTPPYPPWQDSPPPAPPLLPLPPGLPIVQAQTTDELLSALEGAHGVIVLSDGVYTGQRADGKYADSESAFVITRDVTIRAATPGGVTLDGEMTRRVLKISGGTVVLEGLKITRGRGMPFVSHQVKERGGAGIYISSGILKAHDCQIYSSGQLVNSVAETVYGGGVLLTGGSASLHGSTIYDNHAINGGGIMSFGTGFDLENCTIHSNSARTQGGGIAIFFPTDLGVSLGYSGFYTITITTSNVSSNRCSFGFGGSLYVYPDGGNPNSGGLYALLNIANSVFTNNVAVEGGGMYLGGGITYMTTSLVDANTATIRGGNVLVAAGFLYYRLPTVPGYWLPNAACKINRKGCGNADTACTATRDKCSLTAGDTPIATVGSHTYACKPKIAIQPCDVSNCQDGATYNASDMSNSSNCLLGKSVYFTPYAPIDEPFPNPCAAGYLGSSESESQTSSECAGRCEEGYFCPSSPTLVPILCPEGNWCAEGSTTPRPCPPGFFSNQTGNTRVEDCIACRAGHACQAGSKTEQPCSPGSFAANQSSVECTPCPRPAMYQANAGATQCKICGAGNYSANILTCLPCATSDYCEQGVETGQPCQTLLADSTTTGPGAAGASECVCKAGRFMNYTNSALHTNGTLTYDMNHCDECPAIGGYNCTDVGSALETLRIQPGYWRAWPLSTFVRRCFTPKFCERELEAVENITSLRAPASPKPPPPPGPPNSGTCVNTCEFSGDGDCDDGGEGSEYETCTPCTDCADCGVRSGCSFGLPPPSPSRRLLDLFDDTSVTNGSQRAPGANGCRQNHTGPYCELCMPNFVMATDGCVVCGGNAVTSFALPITVFILVLGISLYAFRAGRLKTLQDAIVDAGKGGGTSTDLNDAVGGELKASIEGAVTSVTEALQEAQTEVITEAVPSYKPDDPQSSAVQLSSSTTIATAFGSSRVLNVPKSWAAANKKRIIGLQVKLRIAISFIQVAFQIVTVFSIPYPPFYQDVLSYMNLISLDFLDMVPIGCTIQLNHDHFLLLRTLIPLVFLLISFAYRWRLLALAASKRSSKAASNKHLMLADQVLTINFALFYLLFPSNSANIFATLQCETMDDPGQTSFLRKDFSVDCKTAFHRGMEGYAYLMMLVYPIGVPAVYAYLLLFKHRAELQLLRGLEMERYALQDEARMAANLSVARADHVRGPQTGPPWAFTSVLRVQSIEKTDETTLAKMNALKAEQKTLQELLPDYVKKLVLGYDMRVFYFELFECARKLAIICLPVWFQPSGSVPQLMFGLMVCFLSFGLYMLFSPYIEPDDDRLAQLCQVQIFFALLSSVALKYDPETLKQSTNLGVLLSLMTVLPMGLSIFLESPLHKWLFKAYRSCRTYDVQPTATPQPDVQPTATPKPERAVHEQEAAVKDPSELEA